MELSKRLLWRDEFSVNVKLLDAQHQRLIDVINLLIDCINSTPSKDKISAIVAELVAYKQEHFATEEKYFTEFNYPGTVEHIAAHREFNKRVEVLQAQYQDDPILFAFKLVDFLEDWLVEHLNALDHKYTKCFNEHGLY